MTPDETWAFWQGNRTFVATDFPKAWRQHQWVDEETRTRSAASHERPMLAWFSDINGSFIASVTEYRTPEQYKSARHRISCDYADARWRCVQWMTGVESVIQDQFISILGDPNCFSYDGLDATPEVLIQAKGMAVWLCWAERMWIVNVPSIFGVDCGGCFGCDATPETHKVASHGWVYFLRARDTKHIKIGHSVQPYGRLNSLQTGNASVLEMLAITPGGRAVERGLHQLFAKDRVRPDGEWFHPSHALMAFIREVGGVK